MGRKDLKKIASLAMGILILSTQVFAQQYKDWRVCPKFNWEKNWEEWAKITANPEWAFHAKRQQLPEALALGKAWADYLGYDAVSMINKSKLAPDIVPGLVINERNYHRYPGLRKLLPPNFYNLLKKGSYAQLGEVNVCPTQHSYHSWGLLKMTKKNKGLAKVTPEGELLNWKGGVPFPFPKTACEMVHNLDRTGIASDQFSFNPAWFNIFDRKGKQERLQKAYLFWRFWKGRRDLLPIPEDPQEKEVAEKGSVVFIYPFDIKGYAGVRTRFVDPKRDDGFEIYLPFLRRIRKLSGTDTQDPLIGTDIAWEDWKGWWQKLTPYIWPAEYKLIEKDREVLVPVKHSPVYELKGPQRNQIFSSWERRPVWVVEWISKSPTYFYSKRRCWLDKELFILDFIEMYDLRKNLWRKWVFYYGTSPENGYLAVDSAVDVIDHANSHRTAMRTECIPNDPKVTSDYFSLGWLRKMAH